MKNKQINPKDRKELSYPECYCSEQYHRFTLGKVVGTDGVVHAIEKANCHWMFSDAAIALDMVVAKKHPDKTAFLVWKIEVFEDDSAIVTAHTDSEENGSFSKTKLVYEQKYEYTTFKRETGCNYFEWYSQDNVMLLKSEY